jgi:hypothetical protein
MILHIRNNKNNNSVNEEKAEKIGNKEIIINSTPANNLIFISNEVENKDVTISEMEEVEGDFKTDKANKIISARLSEDKELLFVIEWKQRQNGSIPWASVYKGSELKKIAPELLFSFYESKIRYGPNINNLNK